MRKCGCFYNGFTAGCWWRGLPVRRMDLLAFFLGFYQSVFTDGMVKEGLVLAVIRFMCLAVFFYILCLSLHLSGFNNVCTKSFAQKSVCRAPMCVAQLYRSTRTVGRVAI